MRAPAFRAVRLHTSCGAWNRRTILYNFMISIASAARGHAFSLFARIMSAHSQNFPPASEVEPAEPPATARRRPNVLFYLPDQVRQCDVGCYGGGHNAPTPNIDLLASQGMRFTNALSTYPLCTPYRAMLQTGRMPAACGAIMNWINVPVTGPCLADTFNEAGYATGYIGKWHLAAGERAGTLHRHIPPPNIHPESEFVPPGPARMGYRHWEAFNFHVDFYRAFYYRDTPEKLYMPKFETDSETDMAIGFMKKNQAAGQPFFLVVSPHPPHPIWSEEQTPADSLAATPRELHQRPNFKPPREDPIGDPRCYYAMLRNLDDNFGRLLDYLDEAGLADDTLVVFASDHGEMMGSQSRYNKMVPYAEAIDVPLIMRWPGQIPADHVSTALFLPVDHFPTLAALCGENAPGGLDGHDLSWAVLGRSGQGRDDALLMNFVSHWDYPETGTQWPEWRGVRTARHTYVKWLDGREELYDNLADPYQLHNLFDGDHVPPVLAHLRGRLSVLLREAHDEFLPGDQYRSWFNLRRDVVKTACGPVPQNSTPAWASAA
jgi:arylsulfatase A-like enzyme